jgi:NADH oxidase (H2O2-forming)
LAKRIVVIGGNASGTDAASAARKTDRTAEITVVTREAVPSYSRCGLPFVLSGEIPRFEDLIVFKPRFYKMLKIDLRTETEAQRIDAERRVVTLATPDGATEELPYDALILATGSTPFVPAKYIEGCDTPGVHTLRTLDDGRAIQRAMAAAKAAVVVGAGFIGLEVAHAFLEQGIATTIAEALPCILPNMFDRDMARLAQRRIEATGVTVRPGEPVQAILGGDHVTGAKIGGETIPADLILMATGVTIDASLARSAGAATGARGAVKVNHRMATTVPDVYAVGDCAETYHMLTGVPVVPALGTTGVRQGKVAGINAAGGYSSYPGTLISSVSTIFGFQVGATGLTEFAATRAGYTPVVGRVTSKTKADYFPGGTEIRVKMLAERERGRILGCQIVAGEEVTQRINTVSTAIMAGLTVFEMAKADTCYAPPVNETWEPVALAAEATAMRLRR